MRPDLQKRAWYVVASLVGLLPLASPVRAQSQTDVWRTFAKTLTVSADIDVRLRDGERFRATLVAATDDRVLVQPRTRIPVPVQPIPYDAVTRLAPHQDNHRSARAAAIGTAAGAGSVLVILWRLIAAADRECGRCAPALTPGLVLTHRVQVTG